jgi:hypothetical protein
LTNPEAFHSVGRYKRSKENPPRTDLTLNVMPPVALNILHPYTWPAVAVNRTSQKGDQVVLIKVVGVSTSLYGRKILPVVKLYSPNWMNAGPEANK